MFPKRVDFTDWLWQRHCIMVPEAVIIIHSAQWDDAAAREGKAVSQWPDRVEYRLLDNSTEDQSGFASLLYNAMATADKTKVDRTVTPKISAIQRIYNWLSYAAQEQMLPHYYPYSRLNKERLTNVPT